MLRGLKRAFYRGEDGISKEREDYLRDKYDVLNSFNEKHNRQSLRFWDKVDRGEKPEPPTYIKQSEPFTIPGMFKRPSELMAVGALDKHFEAMDRLRKHIRRNSPDGKIRFPG